MTGKAYSLTLPEPPSANRWWRKFKNRMVLSAEAREYKANVAAICMVNRVKPFAGEVCVTLAWYRGRKAGDLDKRIGIVLDALQGSFYANDSQIVSLSADRYEDKENPRLHVTVRAA